MEQEKSLRYNEGKLKWSYIDFKSLESMVRVMMKGAEKYEPFNWQKGLDLNEVLESLARHLFALMRGEINDPESGEHHMAHVMCNAMFWEYHYNKQNENKDI